MKILAIESSCDETACAVVDSDFKVWSNVIASQIDIHQATKGVVPEVAARAHVGQVQAVFDQALSDADVSMDDIDAVAVAKGPGLLTSLAVGTSFASSIAWIYDKPLIPVNHIHGHIFSNWLDRDEKIEYPVVVLTVSGGHNELVLVEGPGSVKLLGETLDDAAGEAFDKVAKMMDLGYPGGPVISRLAEDGNVDAYDFPRPMLGSGDYNFSFSGLKTAVWLKVSREEYKEADIAASFQEAACDILVTKLLQAADEFDAAEVHLVGGVSANNRLREMISQRTDLKFRHPAKITYCTDNAAMIAGAAHMVPKSMWLKAGESVGPGLD